MSDPRHADRDRIAPEYHGTFVAFVDERGEMVVLAATGAARRELEDTCSRDPVDQWAEGQIKAPGPGFWLWTGYIRWSDGCGEEPEPSCDAHGTFTRLSARALWALAAGRPDTIGACQLPLSFT